MRSFDNVSRDGLVIQPFRGGYAAPTAGYSAPPPVGYGRDAPSGGYARDGPPAGYGRDAPPPGYGARPQGYDYRR